MSVLGLESSYISHRKVEYNTIEMREDAWLPYKPEFLRNRLCVRRHHLDRPAKRGSFADQIGD